MSEKHDIGRWVGQWGMRYWEGACTCGSGRTGHEVYDDNGIYFGISCSKCNKEAAPGPYEEPIDED